MHNAALRELARSNTDFENWRYFRFDISPERLVEAIPFFHRKGFLGLNLTVPHKELAWPAVESVDPSAKPIKAVNTLKRADSGYIGFNTDGYGLSQGIKSELRRSLVASEVLLLGAGGAARAAAIQCLNDGCSKLAIVNRNTSRLATLIDDLNSFEFKRETEITAHAPSDQLPLTDSTIIINATSLGLKPDDPVPLPCDSLPRGIHCFDMIYNPPATKLMQRVSQAGGLAANGLSMLVYQGAKSLSIWSGEEPPVPSMRSAAEDALASYR